MLNSYNGFFAGPKGRLFIFDACKILWLCRHLALKGFSCWNLRRSNVHQCRCYIYICMCCNFMGTTPKPVPRGPTLACPLSGVHREASHWSPYCSIVKNPLYNLAVAIFCRKSTDAIKFLYWTSTRLIFGIPACLSFSTRVDQLRGVVNSST